ncbi:MAG: cupin domain-containing protein [Phycisphaerales bacterium]|nr:cupin domain-containing protein [Phycisphaerales bacterium]
MDVKFGPNERIDIPALVAECRSPWFNQTLCRVNDSVVRLGIFEGEFHWHKHDRDDEFFLVLSGRLFIDMEGRTVELGPQQGVTIPRGAMHRPRAPQKTVVLMMETDNIVPTGD